MIQYDEKYLKEWFEEFFNCGEQDHEPGFVARASIGTKMLSNDIIIYNDWNVDR